ncbi:MAG: tetrahydromethanopterin S-methyltransferase subunit H [Candidatus Bathyarchaeia archaeon]
MNALFRFEKEQRFFEIGRVKVGGQPGQLPTVLIGSIFHRGHKIVEDPKRGVFDRKRAERLIRRQEELSEKTGNPHMLDIVGETSEALKGYVDFAARVTDAPILLNGPEATIRVEAARYAASVGLLERTVYNSINYTATREELAALKKSGVRAAVIQAFNPRNPRIEGMRQQLLGTAGGGGLLEAASRAGVEKTLVLTPVLDIPSIGVAAAAIYALKKDLGLPTGTAPVGVIGRWRKTGEFKGSSKRLGRAVAATLAQSMGANFIIYGSIGRAADIFPACALTDAMIAYNAATVGVKPLTREHPLYKVL